MSQTAPTDPGPQNRLGRRKALTFALLTIAVFFVSSEILLRLFYRPLPPPQFQPFVNPEWKTDAIFATDSELFWRFLPDRTIEGSSPRDGSYSIQINREGHRGLEMSSDLPADGTRILTIGDSCIFGWDAPEGKNFPERLVAHLIEDPRFGGPPPILFQRGVPGYSSHQALLLLEEWGPRIEPDWVILYVGTNDCVPCVGNNDREISESSEPSRLEPILRMSYTALALRDFLFLFAKNAFFEEDYNLKVDFQTSPARVPLDHFGENVGRFVETARDLGAKVVLLTRQNVSPNPRLETYNDRIRDTASADDILLVDVAARFRQYATTEVYTRPNIDPVHPNSLGYDLIARWTAEQMLSDGDVDSDHDEPNSGTEGNQ